MATQQQPRSTLVSVGVLSAGSTLCLARVFTGWGWLLPVLAAATISVALGALVDRWGRRTPVTVGALVIVGLLAGLETSEPAATVGGLPTPTALSDYRHDLAQMGHVLHSAAVPVPALGTALLLAVLAAWMTGTVSYLCATRLAGSLAPLVAPLTVFVTVSALGRGSHAPTTAAFGAGVALFLLAQHRSTLSDRRARFHAGSARATLPVAGALAAIVAIMAALFAGPNLPGARSNALLDYRKLGGQARGAGNLVVVTPLVDIRDRLKESPAEELFTVESDHPTYWRIAGLDKFDGQVWGIAETQSAPIDDLESAGGTTGTTESIQARFNTTTLAGPWVPVAYRPTSVDLQGARVLPGSDTVIIRRTDAINSTYDVLSEEPAPTPDQIAAAHIDTSASAQADLELPDNFPSRVTDLAKQITAKAATPYAQALALQNYLRDNFKYSLSVPKGHSDTALVDFLFDTKAGFCEQFSSAFAAMARSIGLPTRVAVGFTPGTPDASGVYHVTTQDAHAWPEVDFAGLGWIRFEPTPGRSDPTPGDYTQTGGASTETTTPNQTTAPTTTSPGTSNSETPSTNNHLLKINSGVSTGTGSGGSGHSAAAVVLHSLLVIVATTLALALLFAASILSVKRFRRYRRRHASTNRAQITGAWDEALERLAEARIHRRPSSTPVEFAMREAPAAGVGGAGPPLLALAHLATTALYAPDEPDPEVADEAWEQLRELEVALRTNAAARARVRRRLDPRVLRTPLPGDGDSGDDGSLDDALTVVII